MSDVGRTRRLARLFDPSSQRTVIVPVDDSLIAGPIGGLQNLKSQLLCIERACPNGILGFPGQFEHQELLNPHVGWICNLTASTTRSAHTRKILIGSVGQALSLGADAVAVHVNTTSKHEGEMLAHFAGVAGEARDLGVPVVAIMYPRRERPDGTDDNYEDVRNTNEDLFTTLVAHAVRVARDLGASLVKTQFTGSPDSFRTVVEAASPVPVVIAGGPLQPCERVLTMAHEATAAGAAGVSFGRNVYGRDNVGQMITALRLIVHEGASVADAMQAIRRARHG